MTGIVLHTQNTFNHAVFRQVNYLFDDAAQMGKGANTITDMLHHFVATHSFGEVHLKLHADNCSGQNKNRTITISFLIMGHTKFSPDWCFGLFKQIKVSCLDDIVRVVKSSIMHNW